VFGPGTADLSVIIEWIRDVLGEWPRRAAEPGVSSDVIGQIGAELGDRVREVGLGRWTRRPRPREPPRPRPRLPESVHVHDARKMLSTDSFSMPSNALSDCCAVSPSSNAREKLATMP